MSVAKIISVHNTICFYHNGTDSQYLAVHTDNTLHKKAINSSAFHCVNMRSSDKVTKYRLTATRTLFKRDHSNRLALDIGVHS